jgi:transposase
MHPLVVRRSAINCYVSGCLSLRKTSKAFGISKASLCRWLRRAQPQLRLTRFGAAVESRISSALLSNPALTMGALARILRCEGIRISRSSASRAARGMGFSRVKARRQVEYSSKQALEHEFRERLGSVDQDSIISVDEAAVYIEDGWRFGYVPKGQRLRVALRRGSRPRRKVTLLLAISNGGIESFSLHERNVNGEAFLEFMMGLPRLRGSNIVLDNVAFHKTSNLRAIMAAKGAELHFTPPYSPECNPVEMAFSSIKRRFRSFWREDTSSADRLACLVDCIEGCSVHCGPFIRHVFGRSRIV